MRFLLLVLVILFSSNAAFAKKGCQPITDGVGKAAIGAAVGGVGSVVGLWAGAIISGPFTAGSSIVGAWYGTVPAFTFGAKGGAIAGAYLEGGQCAWHFYKQSGDDDRK